MTTLGLQDKIRWLIRVQWSLAAALIVLALAFYFIGYRPAHRKLDELAALIAEHEHDLAANQNHTRILPNVAADVESLRQKLANTKTLPRQQELPQFIRDIAQLGSAAALKQFDYKPGTPMRDDHFNELPLSLSFSGDFMSVFSFLRNTEQLARLTRVKSISLRCKDPQGQVKVKMDLNIYFAGETG